MATSEHGEFDNTVKSPYSFEYYDSSWELELMKDLEKDNSVKKWKKLIGYKDWSKRPFIPEKYRVKLLAGFECVDYITIFNETDCIKFVESIKPNVHVNGSEYGKNCIEAPTVKKYGGRIYIVDKIEGLSTSDVIKKIKDS